MSLIFNVITDLRNYLFDNKILNSVRFEIPVISIGNLSVGGTGKTPHTAMFLNYYRQFVPAAVLSRGYGRKTSGFRWVNSQDDAANCGDEPLWYKKMFPNAHIAVGEDRVVAIPRMLQEAPEIGVILLDDAYQHRRVRPGLSVLITDYHHPFCDDHIVPLGWLRERRENYHRADIIIISKCPENLTEEEFESLRRKIHPFSYQHVYASTLEYGPLFSITQPGETIALNDQTDVLLVCGIAHPKPLEDHLKSKAARVFLRDFKDHHLFDIYDMESFRTALSSIDVGRRNVIVTTEKDAMRLMRHMNWILTNKIEIFVQPVRVKMLFDHGQKLGNDLQLFLKAFQTNGDQTDDAITDR